MKYFSYDPEGNGFEFHNTPEEAKLAAENSLASSRDFAIDYGWDDSVTLILWGEIKERVTKVRELTKAEAIQQDIYIGGDFDFICDYELKELL